MLSNCAILYYIYYYLYIIILYYNITKILQDKYMKIDHSSRLMKSKLSHGNFPARPLIIENDRRNYTLDLRKESNLFVLSNRPCFMMALADFNRTKIATVIFVLFTLAPVDLRERWNQSIACRKLISFKLYSHYAD